jgi:hypothetical protein
MHILKCPPGAMLRGLIQFLLGTFLKELIVNDVMVRAANIFKPPRQVLRFRTSVAKL